MRFEDLPKAERDALAEYGYEVAAEMEAMDEPPAAATASRGTPSDARSASPPRPRGGAMAFARPRVSESREHISPM